MAIRDALKSERGARAFAEGLYALLYGPGSRQANLVTGAKLSLGFLANRAAYLLGR